MPRLRQNTRRLKERACNSLTLAIELFNRPHEAGRVEATLILLLHSLEMLLKAKIWEERGAISERGSGTTYSFRRCLRIARSDLCLLDDDEDRTLGILNDLRDCAAHNLLELSEENLYLHVQAGVTLFGALLERSFGESLANHFPNRVLPVSTNPPTDIDVFLDKEFTQIRELLAPGKHRRSEVAARLRPFLIMEANVQGVETAPTSAQVARASRQLRSGKEWRAVFPGVASLRLDTAGHGLSFSVRFTRDPSAIPVRRLGPGEETEGAVLVREVNLLDRYSLGMRDLASRLGLTVPRAVALVEHLRLQEDEACFRRVTVGRTTFKRYSPTALERLRAALPAVDMDQVWKRHREQRALRRQAIHATAR